MGNGVCNIFGWKNINSGVQQHARLFYTKPTVRNVLEVTEVQREVIKSIG